MQRGCSRRLRGGGFPAGALALFLLLAGCGTTTRGTHDDQMITTQVKIALLSDPQVGGLRLDVRTFQGVVTLGGTVRSTADQQRAIALATRIQGVRDVRSEMKLEVRTLEPYPPQ